MHSFWTWKKQRRVKQYFHNESIFLFHLCKSIYSKRWRWRSSTSKTGKAITVVRRWLHGCSYKGSSNLKNTGGREWQSITWTVLPSRAITQRGVHNLFDNSIFILQFSIVCWVAKFNKKSQKGLAIKSRKAFFSLPLNSGIMLVMRVTRMTVREHSMMHCCYSPARLSMQIGALQGNSYPLPSECSC